ncbi:hypothetical protein CVS47_03200 [Microbacterium lemovicicum]|uniref:Glycosyl transferase family 28 C-terminal domain-containing protein n=1 Tax=Microbacterium lemovicicum TaxID=1072463 RepID=A0A3S9WES5_9MICO|nr:hypothetical protein [Microbacterium lemovicicum]AZS38542.1 hypothetical protein CVS47_03200 [Microbacterium lemovicicum]
MIGWYVHHHGFGHATRFLAVRPHLLDAVTVFSSLAPPADVPAGTDWVRLPADDTPIVRPDGSELSPRAADPTAGGALHWAPLGHRGHRSRLAVIAAALEARDIDVMVVDVSAEVATLARLLGTPTVVVTQPGERTDAPHLLAYGLASCVLAPWARGLLPDPPATTTVFTGGISRFDGRVSAEREDRSVLFLGRVAPSRVVADAARLLTADGWTCRSIGAAADDRVADPWPLLSADAVIVSAAGQNSVADLAAADARAVVVPQERPFDEQRATGEVLRRHGLAVVAEPDPDAETLVSLIREARDLRPDWSVWGVSGAAARAAAVIEGARR